MSWACGGRACCPWGRGSAHTGWNREAKHRGRSALGKVSRGCSDQAGLSHLPSLKRLWSDSSSHVFFDTGTPEPQAREHGWCQARKRCFPDPSVHVRLGVRVCLYMLLLPFTYYAITTIINYYYCFGLSATLWTVAHQAPPSMEFSRPELEWVAVPFSRGSSQPRDQTQIACIAGGFFTV